MARHRHWLPIAATLGLGVMALAFIPGAQPKITEAGAVASPAVSSVAGPSPQLLRMLDNEVAPSTPAQPETIKVTAVEPVSTPIVPVTSTPTPPTPPLANGFVGPSAVNMRSGPSGSSGTVAVLAAGQPVQLGQISGGWVQVTLADGRTGWVYGSYLGNSAPPAAASAPAPQKASPILARAVIQGDDGDLEDRNAHIASRLAAFARPLDSAPSIFTLQPGDEVHIAEVRGDWLRVETSDGISGWIRRAD